ncbi:MAG TPA: phosphatidate cytidylyltransferase [Rhizomicrobium sp.]|nr:phosphatidate cytidylyltransferase [Rhizomicrobium sp.]
MNDTPETASPGGILSANSGRKPLKFSLDWITRPVFGLLLAGIAVAALYNGGFYFAFLVVAVMVAAAREWHRMIAQGKFTEEFVVTSVVVAAAVFLEVSKPGSIVPWTVVGAGTIVSFALASLRGRLPFWEAGGVLYLGVPALAAVMLRTLPEQSFDLLLIFLIAIWATDTGALIFGNLIGGPKLWPALSPNKTWAGFFGGILVAAIAGSVAFPVMHLGAGRGALFAALVGVIAHMGDLFESWVKRTFRIKNSGGLIPGHGGVLDRIDSTLLAVPVLAASVFIAGINPVVAQ